MSWWWPSHSQQAQINQIYANLKKNTAAIALLLPKKGTQMVDYSLDQLLASVQAQTTVVASLQTYVAGLKAQIAAIPSLTPAQQTEIDTIFASAEANTAAISAAMLANTPAA